MKEYPKLLTLPNFVQLSMCMDKKCITLGDYFEDCFLDFISLKIDAEFERMPDHLPEADRYSR